MKHSKKKGPPPRFEKEVGEVELDESDNYSSGSEEEYTASEKKLMNKLLKNNDNEPKSDEELYGVLSSDEMASDIEDEEDDLPNVRAWGKEKMGYYATDYVDQDYGSLVGKETQNAEYEEKEARDIQLRMAKSLDDTDYSFDLLVSKETSGAAPEENDSQQKVKSDLSSLSKRQKQALFHKESPEFTSLVEDLKNSMTELEEKLEPFLKLVKSGLVPECPATKLVATKYDLTLNYVTNITFYLLLKAKRRPVQEHPVVRRLVQYRQLLQHITPMWTEIVEPQVDQLLELHEQGVDIQPMCFRAQKKLLQLLRDKSNEEKNISKDKPSTSSNASKSLRATKRPNTSISEEATMSEDVPVNNSKSAKRKRRNKKNHIENAEDAYLEKILQAKIAEETVAKETAPEEEVGKRGINRQIAKNKGLTPRRKKEDRNPRVKNKRRYNKALIRRKGQVRTVRNETSRYGGEISGIKTHLRKGTKIKV